MTKMLRFSVTEQTGRTFDLPLEEAYTLIKEDCPDYNPEEWSEIEVAEHLYNCLSDMIAKYEKENCYFESHVQDEEIYE